jgi:hypothetical protein
MMQALPPHFNCTIAQRAEATASSTKKRCKHFRHISSAQLHKEQKQRPVRPKNDASTSATVQLHNCTKSRCNGQLDQKMMQALLPQRNCTIAQRADATGSSTKKRCKHYCRSAIAQLHKEHKQQA